MKNRYRIIVIAVSLCFSGEAAAGDNRDGAKGEVAVWVDVFDVGNRMGFEHARAQIREIGVSLVLETAQRAPTVVEAIETLLVHRAMAVIWHDREGGLQILFEGEGKPERITAASGAPEEEGLYLAELLRARLEEDEETSDLLVTAPNEVMVGGSTSTAKVKGASTDARLPPHDGGSGLNGLGIVVGYFARAHTDDVRWWQQGISFGVPSWRISELWELGGRVRMGLPSSIGEEGTQWLQLRTFGVGLEAGLIPFRGERLEAKLSMGAGVLNTMAVAFLSDGESESRSHLSGEISAGFAVVWRSKRRLAVAVFASCVYVMSPPSFSINGKGDFGAAPWQPVVGLDISVGLSGR